MKRLQSMNQKRIFLLKLQLNLVVCIVEEENGNLRQWVLDTRAGCSILQINTIDNYALGYYCDEALDDEFAKIQDVVIFAKGNKEAKRYAEENDLRFFDSTDYTDYFDYIEIKDDYILIIDFYGCPYSNEIIIPSEIEGQKVCEIADYAFSDSIR